MGEGVLVVYQNGAGPSLIVSGLNQRVYPNTHCSGMNQSMGLQWVLSDATHCVKFSFGTIAKTELHYPSKIVFHQAPLTNVLHSLPRFGFLVAVVAVAAVQFLGLP